MKSPRLKSFRLQNFKAVRDSGPIKFGPLTVFIGNNGSGKSSVIEGLDTFQRIVQEGLDAAMRPWHGFEHVWNRAVKHEDRAETKEKRAHQSNPMRFVLAGTPDDQLEGWGPFRAELDVTMGPGGNTLFIQREDLHFRKGINMQRNDRGEVDDDTSLPNRRRSPARRLDDGKSMMQDFAIGLGRWQFLALVPQQMTEPVPQKRSGGDVRLAANGSNIAQYMSWIRSADQSAFAGVLEAMQYVLPYARDVQPQLTSELERSVYLQMTEAGFKIPGWMFSTGTLRVLALLALLRSPEPPPLIAVEEIENGLDPRGVNLVLQEIQGAVESGRTQVIVTTHSPYLLDLLDLSHLVFCERIEGEPVFVRPQDRKGLRAWAKSFAPGQLYVMDRIHAEGR